jgi:uncharacterized protein YegP (UPF0339 family)
MSHDYDSWTNWCDEPETPSTATRKSHKPKKSKKSTPSTTTRKAGSKRKGGEQGEGNRFNVYVDADGRWRWRLWGENNKILADGGQGYASNVATRNAIRNNILSLRSDTPIKTTPAPVVVPVLPPSASTGTQPSASTGTVPSANTLGVPVQGAVSLNLLSRDNPNVVPGQVLVPFVVEALNAGGQRAVGFTGVINATLGNTGAAGNVGASSFISGTVSKTAVQGVATFDDLTLQTKGTGFSIVFRSSGLSDAVSPPFTIA